jgi:hypothetical protein
MIEVAVGHEALDLPSDGATLEEEHISSVNQLFEIREG